MASQTQGIQQLLAAEKRAAEKVSEARKRKLDFFHLLLSLIFIFAIILIKKTYFASSVVCRQTETP